MVTDIIATEAHGITRKKSIKAFILPCFLHVLPWLLRKLATSRSDSVFQVYNRAYAQVP